MLVNAINKPVAYLQRFPHGELPILEQENQKIIAPELICMFLNECNPNQKAIRAADNHEARVAIWHKVKLSFMFHLLLVSLPDELQACQALIQ